MSIRAHYLALESVLRAELPTTYKVYVWDVPAKPTFPYVLLWGDLGQESGESLAGISDHLSLRPRITYVGQAGGQVAIVADRVRDILRDRTLTVPGRALSRLSQEGMQTVQPDHQVTIEGTTQHPIFATDEFPFTSQRS